MSNYKRQLNGKDEQFYKVFLTEIVPLIPYGYKSLIATKAGVNKSQFAQFCKGSRPTLMESLKFRNAVIITCTLVADYLKSVKKLESFKNELKNKGFTNAEFKEYLEKI